MEKYLLSCDWGSTAFRLRLIEMPAQRVIGEVFTDDGITRTFNSWKASAADKEITRKQFFLDQLKKQKRLLADKLSTNLDNITIVVSGMASSSIGMQELPYAQLPFATDGAGASIYAFDAETNFNNPIILISGVRSNDEAIRGEETQLIGLVEVLNLQQEAILILPGTHSKHLHIKGDELIAIQTYMTGELFSVLINHSILKDSVDNNASAEMAESEIEGFKLGLKAAGSNLLNSLFTVRTNQLFNKLNKKQNGYYLSGLLIGAELGHLREKKDIPLMLCSGDNLYELYKLALQELGLLTNTTIISADTIVKATIAGQVIIYQRKTTN